LRGKAVYGTSGNAVKPKLALALSVYALAAIGKRQLRLDLSPDKILQILVVTVFAKAPILEGFSNLSDDFTATEPCIQLNPFDLYWDRTDLKQIRNRRTEQGGSVPPISPA